MVTFGVDVVVGAVVVVVVEWSDDCCVPAVVGAEATTVVGDDVAALAAGWVASGVVVALVTFGMGVVAGAVVVVVVGAVIVVVVEWTDDCCVPTVVGGEAAIVGDDEVEPAMALMAVAKSALEGAAMPRAVRNTVRALSNCWKSSEESGVLLSNERSSNGSTPRVALVRRRRALLHRAAGTCRGEREPKNQVMGLSLPWARGYRRHPAERNGQGSWGVSALHASRRNRQAGNTPSLGITGSQGRPGKAGTTGAVGQCRQFG
jgi:hypothetical protein